MSDDQLPPLEDFEEDLKTLKYTHNPQTKASSQDYTKPNVRHIQDQSKQKQQLKKVEKQVEKLTVQVQSTKKKQQFGGIKKGFFSSGPKQKKEKITEVKATNKNPLEIKEVQQAMKMNNYLQETKNEWRTDKFMDNVEKNQKIQKLMSNPQAIQMFQKNPKEAMQKYAQNKEVMQGFQQFCKLMGSQFQNLAAQKKK